MFIFSTPEHHDLHEGSSYLDIFHIQTPLLSPGELSASSLWHNRPEMNCASEKYGKMLKQSSRGLTLQMGQLIEICCMRPTYKLSESIRNMKSQLYLQMFLALNSCYQQKQKTETKLDLRCHPTNIKISYSPLVFNTTFSNQVSPK